MLTIRHYYDEIYTGTTLPQPILPCGVGLSPHITATTTEKEDSIASEPSVCKETRLRGLGCYSD